MDDATRRRLEALGIVLPGSSDVEPEEPLGARILRKFMPGPAPVRGLFEHPEIPVLERAVGERSVMDVAMERMAEFAAPRPLPGDPDHPPCIMRAPIDRLVPFEPFATKVEFMPRLGTGILRRDPAARVIRMLEPEMPTGPAVDAMLADGWHWTGHDFARTEVVLVWRRDTVVSTDGDVSPGTPVFVRVGPRDHPGLGKHRADDAGGDAVQVEGWRFAETLRPGRAVTEVQAETTRTVSGSARISVARVRSGRYADRLPTNRRRKRERTKARRRARE